MEQVKIFKERNTDRLEEKVCGWLNDKDNYVSITRVLQSAVINDSVIYTIISIFYTK